MWCILIVSCVGHTSLNKGLVHCLAVTQSTFNGLFSFTSLIKLEKLVELYGQVLQVLGDIAWARNVWIIVAIALVLIQRTPKPPSFVCLIA